MNRWLSLSAVVVAAFSGMTALAAQNKAKAENVPEIPYQSVPNFLTMPPDVYLGEGIGVATNSKGHVFVYTRSNETRLFEFDERGRYVREIGRGLYGFAFAHAVRVDSQDNVWAVDEGTNMVIEFDPAGRVKLVLGRRPDAVEQLAALPGNGAYSGANKPYSFSRPTDVAWDAEGDIFVSDGYGDSRIVKYDRNGRFVKSAGTRGSAPGQLNLPHSLASDAAGNLYIADRSNGRVQVWDKDLNFIRQYDNVGTPWTVCVSPGPHQYLFVSNSWPDGSDSRNAAVTGEIYKMELDGTVLGRFGKAGKGVGEFATTHGLDCRDPNALLVSEITSWRVQKIVLQQAAAPSRADRPAMEAPAPRAANRSASAGPAPEPGARDIDVAPTSRPGVPEVSFDANANLFKLPENVYLGEVAGVATDAARHLFVYTRAGAANATVGASRTFYKSGSRLFEFDQNGALVREIGQGVYGFNVAQAVHVDPQGHIWIVDEGSSQVIKFDPSGRIALVLGRKPEAIAVAPPAARGGGAGPLGGPGRANTAPAQGPGGTAGRGGATAAGGPAPGAGRAGGGRGAAGPAGAGVPGDNFTRPADVAWDRAGNIYVADGMADGSGNARVAKFDKDGHFLASWGSRGTEPGQFNALRGIALDAAGNVYVADAGNARIQVLDADGRPKSQITGIGTPSAICISPGAHQYLYSSNSNDPETLDHGEIYKLELDGRVVGKFGRAGKMPKEFGSVNAIDCRSANELYVGELLNWRVQKVTLRP